MCPQGQGRSVPETTVCIEAGAGCAVLGGAPKAVMPSSSDEAEASFVALLAGGFGPFCITATGDGSCAKGRAFAVLGVVGFLRRKNTIKSSPSRRSNNAKPPMVNA